MRVSPIASTNDEAFYVINLKYHFFQDFFGFQFEAKILFGPLVKQR